VGDSNLSSQEFVQFSLQIIVMLGFAVFFGQLMRRLKQPAVLGEMLGGILLGPTIFGLLLPEIYQWLFKSSANVAMARDASIKLGMLFFLFIAGLETNLSDLKKLGRKAALVGLIGTLVPISAGVGLVYAIPHDFWGPTVQRHFFSFALFVGMNLANSANPVLARILMDLGLLKKEIGTLCMTATVVDDLVNWTLFAIILNDIAPVGQGAKISLPMNIVLVLVAFVLILGIGRWLGPRAARWVKSHLSWPSGFIATTSLLILAVSSITEKIGIHAFLGAFLIGAALSGHDNEHKEARQVITTFALSFFAPIYFVSMGMTTNYITNFDWQLVFLILIAALGSKLFGVLLGARVAGMRINRDTWAIAFGLNARGATGIILAGVGLTVGVIDDRIFVAMVVMALVTSILAGPAMNWFLSHRIAQAPEAGKQIALAEAQLVNVDESA
jgi:Kef-type K+ transport system membrane component KefB